MDYDHINYLNRNYPCGARVELLHMEGEEQMKRGLKGTVMFVDSMGQVHVEWDNGSTLALNTDVDTFKKVCGQTHEIKKGEMSL